jgi:hypothetical protein
MTVDTKLSMTDEQSKVVRVVRPGYAVVEGLELSLLSNVLNSGIDSFGSRLDRCSPNAEESGV